MDVATCRLPRGDEADAYPYAGDGDDESQQERTGAEAQDGIAEGLLRSIE